MHLVVGNSSVKSKQNFTQAPRYNRWPIPKPKHPAKIWNVNKILKPAKNSKFGLELRSSSTKVEIYVVFYVPWFSATTKICLTFKIKLKKKKQEKENTSSHSFCCWFLMEKRCMVFNIVKPVRKYSSCLIFRVHEGMTLTATFQGPFS